MPVAVIITTITTTMTIILTKAERPEITAAASLRLMAWLSPAFPTGAFAYSHGLEWAVEAGDVANETTLMAWLTVVLAHGAGRSDTILLRHAHRAVASTLTPVSSTPVPVSWPGLARPPTTCGADPAKVVGGRAKPGHNTGDIQPGHDTRDIQAGNDTGDIQLGHDTVDMLPIAVTANPPSLTEIANLAYATASGRERQNESLDQGKAFMLAAAPWGIPDAPERIPYPVAVGAVAGAHQIPEDATAAAFLQAFTTNLISAAVRLVPLGQTAGLRVLAALEPTILSVATETKTTTLDDLGGCAFRSDLAAMRHETQYTRLFRS